jgi:hypothetical protein
MVIERKKGKQEEQGKKRENRGKYILGKDNKKDSLKEN